MTISKHDKSGNEGPFGSDLERNPGIGQSKGAFAIGEKPQSIDADNTSEGDVENDPDSVGAIDDRLGRTNK